jgi:hypothetical protein
MLQSNGLNVLLVEKGKGKRFHECSLEASLRPVVRVVI